MIWIALIVIFAVTVFFGIISEIFNIRSLGKEAKRYEKKSIPQSVAIKYEKIELTDDIKPYGILMDESEFDELKKCVSRFRLLICALIKDQGLIDMINESSTKAGGDKIPDKDYFRKLLIHIFFKDLKHCYEMMGLPFKISTSTIEGQCLLFITDLFNEEMCVLSDYNMFCRILSPIEKSVVLSAISCLSSIMSMNVNSRAEGDEEFGFSAMLICNGDNICHKRYRTLIKQLAMFIQMKKNSENEWVKNLKE